MYIFSLLFWLKKGRQPETRTISLRITVSGTSVEYSTGIKITPEQWDNEIKRLNLRTLSSKERPLAVQHNKRLDEIEEGIRQIEKEFRIKKKTITAQIIKEAYEGGAVTAKEMQFLEVFDIYLAEMESKVGLVGENSAETLRTYKTRRLNVGEFVEAEFGKKDIYLSEVKKDFNERFKLHLQTRHYCKQLKKIGLGFGQIKKHLEAVEKVLEFAQRRDYIQQVNIHKVTVKVHLFENKEKVFLTNDELIRLQNHTFTLEDLERIGYPHAERNDIVLQTIRECADCFIVGCWTGLAYSEQEILSEQDHIHMGMDGRKWIKIIRKKQKHLNPKFTWIPILQMPQQIFAKYKDHALCQLKNRCLPVPSNAEYNRTLKLISQILDFNKPLTVHVARKTFTTLFVNAVQNPQMAALILGDTEEVMKQHYLSVQHQTISEKMGEFERTMQEKQQEWVRKSS
ncbi:phage integrase SAM-like domain-containing protein [Cytophagaceae bacterium DM2B3-1]|uniref:Phage integrase SAM-like domain-containing protein n=1 Tax=Xanthocytophaga flava TaxID=3048013 RepID=A0ABT7CYQ9_9BACT|nr:phage integrase SAM-like domain-containing protein [Xanthocytophaga flavus]MDJ1498919.1 phage integrase SAM-like domain-containing protein [Xanthocytophaga flavus]